MDPSAFHSLLLPLIQWVRSDFCLSFGHSTAGSILPSSRLACPWVKIHSLALLDYASYSTLQPKLSHKTWVLNARQKMSLTASWSLDVQRDRRYSVDSLCRLYAGVTDVFLEVRTMSDHLPKVLRSAFRCDYMLSNFDLRPLQLLYSWYLSTFSKFRVFCDVISLPVAAYIFWCHRGHSDAFPLLLMACCNISWDIQSEPEN